MKTKNNATGFRPRKTTHVQRLLLLLLLTTCMMGATEHQLWQQVKQLETQDLPRRADEAVQTILEEAHAAGDTVQYIQAVIYRVKYLRVLREDGYVPVDSLLKAEIARSDGVARALLWSMRGEQLAQMPVGYGGRYHWGTPARTRGPVDPNDLRTWDNATRSAEIMRCYERSLVQPELLLVTPLTDFRSLMKLGGGDSTPLNTTMLHLLAHRALDYYQSYSPPPAMHDIVPLDESWLCSAHELQQRSVPPGDSLSANARALRLYQQLQRSVAPQKTEAGVLYTLDRLEWVYGSLPQSYITYDNMLDTMMRRWRDNQVYSDICYKRAELWSEFGRTYNRTGEGNADARQKAVRYATMGMEAYPDSHGGKNCKGIYKTHLSPEAAVFILPVYPPAQDFPVRIDYTNTDSLTLDLYRVDYSVATSRLHSYTELITLMDSVDVFRSYAVNLPASTDYNEHSSEFIIEGLETGAYLCNIRAATGPFSKPMLFQVTSLDLLIMGSRDTLDFHVVDRVSGQPVPGAGIVLTRRVNREWINSATLVTDESGFAPYTDFPRTTLIISVQTSDDCFISRLPLSFWSARRRHDHLVRTFLTDRAIYRPGQTVHFTEIIWNHSGFLNFTPDRHRRQFVLSGPKHSSESSLVLRPDEFGACSGSFTLPRGGATGRYCISLVYYKTHCILVEEYKRPTFSLELNQPQGSFALGDSLTIRGRATAYAGYDLSSASVRWSVATTANINRQPRYQVPGSIIASGETSIASDGSFEFDFPLQILSHTDDARQIFEVNVEITDAGCETRDANLSFTASTQAIHIEADSQERLECSEVATIGVQVQNAAGQPIDAVVQMQVERLVSPDRLLRVAKWESSDVPLYDREEWVRRLPHQPWSDELDQDTWAVAETMLKTTISTATETGYELKNCRGWTQGAYRLIFTATDAQGHQTTLVRHITLYDREARQPPLPQYLWFVAPNSVESGEIAEILIGSAAPDVWAIVEIQRSGKLERQYMRLNNSQQRISIPIIDSDIGGIFVSVAFVKDNRQYIEQKTIQVPARQMQLDVHLTTLRDTLRPGAEETWTLQVNDYFGEPVTNAQIAATLYDASLDAFKNLQWQPRFLDRFRRQLIYIRSANNPEPQRQQLSRRYVAHYQSYKRRTLNWQLGRRMYSPYQRGGISIYGFSDGTEVKGFETNDIAVETQVASYAARAPAGSTPPVDDKPEAPRTKLAETAFFYPNLRTDENGEAVFSFTVPDALTRWKCLAFAYTRDAAQGNLTRKFVTQKQLMAQPNPPRFLRASDVTGLPLRIQNVTGEAIAGTARLEILDAFTMRPLGEAFGLNEPERPFAAAALGGTSVRWDVTVPQGVQAVVLRFRATGDNHTDAVELTLPVLPGRMLVTETLPMPVRGNQSRSFTFDRLRDSTSPTLTHQALTLEFTSNPAWLAVLALPYLMESQHPSSDAVFSRLYANTLAAHIVTPDIECTFALWRELNDGPALLSPLERNHDLKQALLEETPWVRQAMTESQQRRDIALLFDANRLRNESATALRKLRQMQSGGGWPWFPEMRPSEWITRRIVTGLGKLNAVGALSEAQSTEVARMAVPAIVWLDSRAAERYRHILDNSISPDSMHIGSSEAHWLLARSYWPQMTVRDDAAEALDYWMSQARKYWTRQPIATKAMIALALHRTGDATTPGRILASLRDYAIRDEETGWHWKLPQSWWWYDRPIETQALLAQAFFEIEGDTQSADEIRLWLLKQKQTSNWETNTATADACWALLTQGADWLAGNQAVSIEVGGEMVQAGMDDTAQAEAGTGWFRHSWQATEVAPELAEVEVANPNPGPAWGALYWQYFENLDRIEASAEMPLQLRRELLREQMTDQGAELVRISDGDPLRVGDKLVVRLTIETDRAMEYVHIKDMRAAGAEPLDVLSGCEWRDGLCYYRSTRDTATYFFIERLPRGLYVFEYRLWAAQPGVYKAGIGTAQCMYAPEFSAHTQGETLEVSE
ncbi:MAG: hypothetical protein K8R90_04075 [Candidatus Cloacimonetes bacterium]|nr:hypothetical protein [Candidatus Cloacimonadota bacterium]